MKIFIDSAQVEEIELVRSYGLLDGVTTNPSLLKKAAEKHQGKALDVYIDSLLETAGKVPVSLEVKCCKAQDMVQQGKNLYTRFKKNNNVIYIKIPVNPSYGGKDIDFEGLKAIKALSEEGIPVNTTLIFTPEQALLAAKAGATVVSPFAGRIDDKLRKDNDIDFDKHEYFPAYGWNTGTHLLEDHGVISGVDLVDQCVQLLRRYGYKTGVLAASLRNPRQVREAALVGADIATIPLSVIQQLTKHPKTEEGMEKFVGDTIEEYDALLTGQ